MFLLKDKHVESEIEMVLAPKVQALKREYACARDCREQHTQDLVCKLQALINKNGMELYSCEVFFGSMRRQQHG